MAEPDFHYAHKGSFAYIGEHEALAELPNGGEQADAEVQQAAHSRPSAARLVNLHGASCAGNFLCARKRRVFCGKAG